MWFELNLEDTETLLFSAEDIASKGNSHVFNILDNNVDLEPLSSKIKEYLEIDDINLLEPLEKVITDHNKILENLSEEWMDNGYVKKSHSFEDIASDISKNW